MASTYSGNLAIELIGTGDQAGTWGATTNTNLGTALEQAITSTASVTFISGGNSAIALAQSNAFQAARSARLTLTGTAIATQYLFVPAISKSYIVSNSLTNAVIITNQTTASSNVASGTGVTVPAGRAVTVFNDGTNIVETTNYFANLAIGTLNVANNAVVTGNLTVSGNVTISGNVSLSNLSLTTVLPLTSGGTGANSAPAAMTNLMGFTTTVTANSNTVLTNVSSYYQIFTGTGNQNVALPVVSTLSNGWTFHICNNSTGSLSVQSSGANVVITVPSAITVMCTAISNTGTTETSWEAGFTDFSTLTGNGSVVLASNATLSNVSVNAYTEGITLGYVNTGSAFTLNIANTTIITANLSATCTFTMPANTAGKSFILFLKTGAGTNTATFTGCRWNSANSAPVITAVANRLDILTFAADGTAWYGNYSQNYIP